jgi:hypothetical protein
VSGQLHAPALTIIEDVQNICPLLCDIYEFFQTDFGKLVAIYVAECCKLLQEYSVLERPGHVDCWHTQHF